MAVNLIYGACGREPGEGVLEAYQFALRERTDYQLALAVENELQGKSHEFPITAQGLRALAGNYPRSEAEAEERLLPAPAVVCDSAMTVRDCMLDQIRKHIREGHPASDFYRDLLKDINEMPEHINPATQLLNCR